MTPLDQLPRAEDFPVPSLPRDLRACAKWRKAGIRIYLRDQVQRADAWTCESRAPGLLVQLAGEKKERHLTLLHAPSGHAVHTEALRWPATPDGLAAALDASAGLHALLPDGLALPLQAEQAERVIEWIRANGTPYAWTSSARGVFGCTSRPEEDVLTIAAEAACFTGETVEITGYASERDCAAATAPMRRYRVDWLDGQPIVEDLLRPERRAEEVERIGRWLTHTTQPCETITAALLGAERPLPPVVVDAAERIGWVRDGATTVRGLLWAARRMLAQSDMGGSSARGAAEAWLAARAERDPARLRLFLRLLIAARRTPDATGSVHAELFPGRDGYVGVVDVSAIGAARWRLYRRSLRWLDGAPLLKVAGVWDTCGDVAGRYRYRGDAMECAREGARWAAEHPDEAIAKAEREGRR